MVCCTIDSIIREVRNSWNTCRGLLHSFVLSVGPVDVDLKRGGLAVFVRVILDLIPSYFQVILLQQSLKNRQATPSNNKSQTMWIIYMHAIDNEMWGMLSYL